jgi:MinD-like ATPase involved in chromosome partitioning or flagellar assembly
MRIKTLIATLDETYAALISSNISEHHADVIDVSVCSTLECMQEMLSKKRYDVALLDTTLFEAADLKAIQLPILLVSDSEPATEAASDFWKIQKYQRISSIVANVLERYAKESVCNHDVDSRCTSITAVWSAAGGVGKTTVALAYAASKIAEGKEAFYLNFEDFSCISGYFDDSGKSISAVFEMLDNNSGNVKMLIRGISSVNDGITYLCSPDNYDDICILSPENITELIKSCAALSDELIINLSCVCDIRTRKVFEIADKILLVTESTVSAGAKLFQFVSQNGVFENIREKVTLVANKGAVINNPPTDTMISLPLIQSENETEVYKTLSKRNF